MKHRGIPAESQSGAAVVAVTKLPPSWPTLELILEEEGEIETAEEGQEAKRVRVSCARCFGDGICVIRTQNFRNCWND